VVDGSGTFRATRFHEFVLVDIAPAGKFSRTRGEFPTSTHVIRDVTPSFDISGEGMALAPTVAEAAMRLQEFAHRHYSASVGESPIAHAAAVLAGTTLIVGGVALVASVVFIPLGMVIGLLGLMLFGAGVVGHIQSPVTFSDAMDAVVGLTGAAIAMTFMLIGAAIVLGLAFTALFEIVQWVAR
jgi:hypothetical protein